MEEGVTRMTVTGQLSSTARFRTFSPQILLKHIFYVISTRVEVALKDSLLHPRS